jgi:hypothetical protein
MTLEQISNELHLTETLLKRATRELDEKKDILASKEEKSQVVSLATKILENYLESVSSSVSGTLEELMRSALKVFNMNIDVTLEYHEGARGGYRTSIRQGNVTGGVNSFGGGVLSLISLIMLVSTIVLKKKRRFIVLDESLNAVSIEYQEGLSNFIRQLCDDFDFNIVLVSHQKSLNTEATRAYEVSSVEGKGTVIRKEL